MDFFDMKFSKLFLERHGEKVFSVIENIIKEESHENYNSKYEECIFKIAFFSLWGLDNDTIRKMIIDMEKVKDIDIQKIKNIHKKSIAKIQRYVKRASETK